jgi:hypothetical protein
MKRRVYWTAAEAERRRTATIQFYSAQSNFSPLEILGRRVRTKVRGPVHAHVPLHPPVSNPAP